MTDTKNLIGCGEMSEALVGNCTTHTQPDYWFPEYDNGRPSAAKIEKLVESIGIAVDLCNSCPAKEACLQEGMQPNDLPFGIWGGKLAGERLESLGKTLDNVLPQSDEGRALSFYNSIKPHLRRIDE